jgi:hypothetical protein
VGKLGELLHRAREHKIYWVLPVVLIVAAIVVTLVYGERAMPFFYSH